jgi:hypothetical protein
MVEKRLSHHEATPSAPTPRCKASQAGASPIGGLMMPLKPKQEAVRLCAGAISNKAPDKPQAGLDFPERLVLD